MIENLEKIKYLKSPATVHPGEFRAFKDIKIFMTDSSPLMFVLIRD